jgi:Ni2+-binding GTPase involved in maturation of urease and hydrogenase
MLRMNKKGCHIARVNRDPECIVLRTILHITTKYGRVSCVLVAQVGDQVLALNIHLHASASLFTIDQANSLSNILIFVY